MRKAPAWLTRRTSNCFFFNDTATTEIYTLSLHDALPISERGLPEKSWHASCLRELAYRSADRSEEHTSELQSRLHLVCRLLLEKKTRGAEFFDALVWQFRRPSKVRGWVVAGPPADWTGNP